MKNPFKIQTIFALVFLFILSLVPLLWFRDGAIMVGHDNVFPLDPITFFQGRLFTWSNLDLGQGQSLIMGTALIHFIDTIPHFFGFSLQAEQKIVYIFWFLGILLSPFVLAKELNKDSRTFQITASILYAFNFFILQGWFIGERTKFGAYIALPLIIAIFIKVYRGKLSILKATAYNGLILFLFNAGGLYGTPLYGGFYVAFFCFLLYFFWLAFLKKDFLRIKKLFLLSALTLLVFFLVNSYYILPGVQQVFTQYKQGVTNTGGIMGIINWASEISSNADYGNLLRLQGIPDWYGNSNHPYSHFFLSNQFLIAASFVWPIIIFCGLLLIKEKEKRKFFLYFFLVYLVGIIFTAGNHPPFGFVYNFLIGSIPGFAIFRTPYYKFAPAIFFSSSFLIAYSLDSLSAAKKKILFPLFILFVLLYHFPFFTGDFFSFKQGFSTRNFVPSYVFDFGQWVQSKKDDGRILLLPENNNDWQYDIYDWGFLSLQLLPTEVANKDILANDDKLKDNERHLIANIYKSLLIGDLQTVKKLSAILNVKYFLIRNDVDYNLSWAPTTSPQTYKKSIEENLHISPFKTFGKWVLYDIASFGSLIVASDRIDVINSTRSDAGEKFIQFSKSSKQFIINNDINQSVVSSIPSFLMSEYEFPDCITCAHLGGTFLILPDRTILPNSPFYPLLQLKEKESSKLLTGKSALYNDLGLTIKRVVELQRLFQERNVDSLILDTFNRYILLLKDVMLRYSSLSTLKEKVDSAIDIKFYLDNEVSLLTDLSFEADKAQKFIELLTLFSQIKTQINPYLPNGDILENKLYEVLIKKSGMYNFYMEKRGLESLLQNKQTISLEVDDQTRKSDFVIDPKRSDLLSFGSYSLSSGYHKLLVKTSAMPNVTTQYDSDSSVGTIPKTSCFSSKIDSFSTQNTYRVLFLVPRDLLNNLYFSIRRQQKDKFTVDKVTKFGALYGAETYEGIVTPVRDTKNVWLIYCSDGLTQDTILQKLKPLVQQVIDSKLLLVSDEKQQNTIPVSYVRKNPTEYMVEFTNSSPIFLSLLARYDSGWKLDGFENNHFMSYGYANGWYISSLGYHKLRIEYRPQQWLNVGGIISALSVIILTCYVTLFRKKRIL